MIDFHTHILPHLDDGAKDTATSLYMFQQELSQGVKTVLCTPHYYGKRSPERFLTQRNNAYAHLKERIPQGIDIRLGAEVHFTGINLPNHEEFGKLTIEGTKIILIELPFLGKWSRGLLPALADVIYETGCVPVIAHVERYCEVRKRPNLISELSDMGCFLQVNARAFIEKRDRKFAMALLEHGFVHCIGSDAHDTVIRSVDLLEAKKAVEKAGYAAEWERAQEIMEKLLAGEDFPVPQGKPIRKFFKSYR
ncbi:MAG: hypothetical protein IJV83_03905 [Clostridia bacterium]|nr:hypothetical protein [Clostridia bacterium]